MSVTLSVADLREALRADDAEPEASDSSLRLLGRLFHEIHADLFGTDPARSAPRFLLGLERDRKVWNERLVDECYRRAVGPRLARHKSYLQGATDSVLAFWDAVRELVAFAVDVTWDASEGNPPPTYEQVAAELRSETAFACAIEQPGWSDSVCLVGVTDCMVRARKGSAWCAIELTLYPSKTAADADRIALYHWIASRLEQSADATSSTVLKLVRFSPKREELLVEAASVSEAQQRLLGLIGKLAGVARDLPSPSTATSAYAELAERVARAYREYGREIEINAEPSAGPRFLRFDARLGKGVRFEQMRNLTPEIGLRLGLTKEPIVSRSGGRLTIDLARPDPQSVPFDSVAAAFRNADPARRSARLLVGVGIDGKTRSADLSDPINAHVLVAGTTGSGKTEWLRSAIASLLIANTPASLRLVLLDPKHTAFTDLKASPFLWAPHGLWVPGGEIGAEEVLGALVVEMEHRYRLFADAGVDDLGRYVEKTKRALPRIVLFCDEYYALLTAAPKEQRKQIETAVGLLGAKARASGVHLVLAMQQASRKVIQGSIDTNIPCRVALMTSTAIESRMVIQADGADQLTGYGDLLYKDIGEPVRLQAPYLEPEARARIFAGG